MTVGENTSCPLCGSQKAQFPSRLSTFQDLGDLIAVDCEICGNFGMTFEAATDTRFKGELHPYLSAATRKTFTRTTRRLFLRLDDWEALENEQRSIRVSQKLTDLLMLIAKHTERPGTKWKYRLENDYPLIAAAGPEEFGAYMSYLEERKFIHPVRGGPAFVGCELTIPGWQEIEPMPRLGGIPGRCFVAMWFSEETRAAYDGGIEPAITDAGFQPIRIDLKEHNNEIPDEIIAEIRNCEFMVADFTGQRAGVYYEAGFAMGLGRTVIWSCRKDEVDKLHFDTNHKNHVTWKTPAELREKLQRRIRATILPRA